MYTWLGASLAWLLGTGLQLMSTLPGRQGCAVGVGLGAALVLAGTLLRRRARGADLGFSAVPGLVALVGLAAMAWGLTGWRAHDRLDQAWPAAWAAEPAEADVRWTGLPRRLGGQAPAAWRAAGAGPTTRWGVDARIVRWLPRAQQGSPAALPATLPDRVQLTWTRPASAAPPQPGEAWRVSLRLRAPDDRVNPGVGDGALGRFARGVRAVGEVVAAEPIGAGHPAQTDLLPASWSGCLLDAVDSWRLRVRDRIQARVQDPRIAGVLAGLTVGDQAAIARDDWVTLQRTGTAHLVSISGTHVALLGVLAAWAVRGTWSRRIGLTRFLPAHLVASWVALAVSALYALGSGWGVPAQRTVWMMAFVTLLGTFGRHWPWPLLWLPGATLVVVLDPWALALPGLWLSFVAVGVLLASGVRLPEASVDDWSRPRWWARWREAGVELLQTQRLVAVALAPLSLVCFQQVSIVGVAVNLLAVPVFTLVFTPLALAGTVWPLCWDLAASGLQATWSLLSACAQAPAAVWTVPALPTWVAFGGVVAAFVLALPVPWAWRALALPFLLPFVALPEAWHLLPRPAPGRFDVIMLDVGQGGGTLVRTTSHTLLFDAGPLMPDGGDLVDRVFSPALQSLGVGHLDALMISHDDADHSGGAASLLKAHPVGALMTPFDAEHPLLQLAAEHRPCEAGLSWTWDGVVFRVLSPAPEDHGASDNDRSCVLQVEAQAASGAGSDREPVRLLLTGDIEAGQERRLLARLPAQALRSTAMSVSHHGSRTSSTPEWLKAVQPAQAVVQVGARNRYGHPSPLVMDRLKQHGIPTVATPACGAWVWASDELGARAPGPGQPALGRCWRAGRTAHWQR